MLWFFADGISKFFSEHQVNGFLYSLRQFTSEIQKDKKSDEKDKKIASS